MRRTDYMLLFLFLICLSGYTTPQFIIDSTYIPQPGDSTKLIQCDTTGILPGDSGINKIWDYSGIQTGTEEFYEAYCLPSATPPAYANQFPEATLASVNNNNPAIYHYYLPADTAWLLLGYLYPGFKMEYSELFCRTPFPVTYGSRVINHFSGIQTVTGGVVHHSGTRDFAVDGSGTLYLPYESYNNAMRTRTLQTTTDSVFVNGSFYSVSHCLVHSYDWYAAGIKLPVFSLVYIWPEGMPPGKSVLVSSKNTPVGLIPRNDAGNMRNDLLSCFPNPASNSVILSFTLEKPDHLLLEITDHEGRSKTLLEKYLDAGHHSLNISLGSFSQGAYLVTLLSGKVRASTKLIIHK